MESGRGIRHAQEVCRGKMFSVDKDIRQPVLAFVRLVIISLIAYFSYGFMAISCLVQVIRFCTRSLYSLLFSDTSYLPPLFVSTKVLRRSVTYDWIYCT